MKDDIAVFAVLDVVREQIVWPETSDDFVPYINYTVDMHRLGHFEQLLLLALVRLGDDTYGVPIKDEIQARTGRIVSPGAIYTALDRLEKRGLVRSRLGEPTPERGGKRKRAYSLTVKGSEAIAQAHAHIAEMARGLKPKLGTP